MRYSFDEGLLDLAKGVIVPHSELVEEMLSIIREDAEELGCLKDVEHARQILATGTSAHRQIATYNKALEAGKGNHEALQAIVDMLIEETATVN